MNRLPVLLLAFGSLAYGQEAKVRSEGGRFWIECHSAPLDEVLRAIAADSHMELWLDQGLSQKRVSARVEAATLKQALVAIFEEVKDVNYVLTFDASNPERVTKIYAGGDGGGRLGREPTIAASDADPEETAEILENDGELPPELDAKALLGSPEAEEALSALKDFFERQKSLQGGEDSASTEASPPELEDLLQNLPQFLASPPKKEKPKDPQL